MHIVFVLWCLCMQAYMCACVCVCEQESVHATDMCIGQRTTLGWSRFFISENCNKLLSPGLVPLPVSSFPQHVSHASGIFNIFESPRQFQCYSFLFQCLGFHLIFWTPLKGWHHFSSSALCSTLSSGWSTPLWLLFLLIIPWYWHLQYTGVFHSN